MPSQDDPDAYVVGFGRPPVHSRFQAGQSGNPKGRRKGVNNLRSDVKKTLKIGVKVNDQGKSRTASTQEAALLRLREKALKGDARSLDRLLDLAGLYNDEAPPPAADEPLSADDDAILAGFLARHGAKPPPDDSTPASEPDGSTVASDAGPRQDGPVPKRRRRKPPASGDETG
jgi:hypothetical protein